MIKISKYKNRKMYNHTNKAYISQPELAELVRARVPVVVTDNKTKRDITLEVAADALFATIRKHLNDNMLLSLRALATFSEGL